MMLNKLNIKRKDVIKMMNKQFAISLIIAIVVTLFVIANLPTSGSYGYVVGFSTCTVVNLINNFETKKRR